VVRAVSPTLTATGTFAYSGADFPPASGEGVPSAGFGPGAQQTNLAIALALFAAGVGVMFLAGGALRRRI
jgi:hypothetical protein